MFQHLVENIPREVKAFIAVEGKETIKWNIQKTQGQGGGDKLLAI